MNTRDTEIGKRIKQYRKGKMTQRELADKIGKTESSIRKYESGLVTIPLNVIEAIATALRVVPFDLMGVEYWDKKYPDISQKSKEYEGFISYLSSLGYIIKDIYSPSEIPVEEFEKAGKMDLVPEECKASGVVPAESHSVEIIKGGTSFILEDDEFEKLQSDIKENIAFKLWQNTQKKK